MRWERPSLRLEARQPEPAALVPFLEGLAARTGWPLEDERVLSLAGLTLELTVDSETTMLRFLEKQPSGVLWDKLERRRYLLSGTVKALRELYLELKDQKVAKAMLVFLVKLYPELFRDLWPRHGLVPPAGVTFRPLGPGDLAALELSLRLRHEHLLLGFLLAEIEVLELYRLGAAPVVWREDEDVFVLPEPVEGLAEREEPPCPPGLEPYLRPRAAAAEGFLYLSVLSCFSLVTRVRSGGGILTPAMEGLLPSLRELYPEPFGLIT